MRAVIYARYSTDLQREASIEDQVRVCRQLVDRESWTVVATYSDAASSRASRLRPGYQKLLEDARAGTFDVVSPRRSTGSPRPGGHRGPLQAAALPWRADRDAGRGQDQRAQCRAAGLEAAALCQGPRRPAGGPPGSTRRRPG